MERGEEMADGLGKAKVYFENLSQINLSRDFARDLKKSAWVNGTGSYAAIDRKTGDILITQKLSKAVEWLK